MRVDVACTGEVREGVKQVERKGERERGLEHRNRDNIRDKRLYEMAVEILLNSSKFYVVNMLLLSIHPAHVCVMWFICVQMLF